MRPEASILSARCEIREIPLTVEYSATETDTCDVAVSFVEQLSARVGPARRVLDVSAVRVTRRPAFAAFRLPRFTRAIVPRGVAAGGGAAPRAGRAAAPDRTPGARPPAGGTHTGHSPFD